MLASAHTGAVAGIRGRLIRAEVDVAAGFPGLFIVGLPDSAVRESESRIKAALRNSAIEFSWDRRITVNLAPANLRKSGSAFDLAIAAALLGSTGEPVDGLGTTVYLGELALDGGLRPTPGVLPIVIEAREKGLRRAIVPLENLNEASLVDGIEVRGVASLLEAIRPGEPRTPTAPIIERWDGERLDLRDVTGQSLVRRALEIAAAGRHNLLLVGPPGSGKTMLARRLPGILPPVSPSEALEMTAIQSAAGLSPTTLATVRPFRSPHHTASAVALVGGGAVPHPGEISLAHGGVLFLDELPEFPRKTLEGLRQPLEEGRLFVSRARATFEFPSRFQLVGAMNPCPCGYRGDDAVPCRCTPLAVAKYQGRISGPLLDRVDLVVDVPRQEVRIAGPSVDPPGEPSARVAERVRAATVFAAERAVSPGNTLENLRLTADALSVLEASARRKALSMRAVHRVARVARTIADLGQSAEVDRVAVLEALLYRASTALTPEKAA